MQKKIISINYLKPMTPAQVLARLPEKDARYRQGDGGVEGWHLMSA